MRKRPSPDSGPLSAQVYAGRLQFTRMFLRWSSQWTQPQLLKLTQAALGEKAVHSSQISNFRTGKLYEPGPKILLALGLFNQMHADNKLPQAYADLWRDRKPMTAPDGAILGPAEMFMVFAGQLDVSRPDEKYIPFESEAEVTKYFGKWIRLQLANHGIDYNVDDRASLLQAASSFDSLIHGRAFSGGQLINDLPAIAKVLDTTSDNLWNVIEQKLAQETA